MTSIEPRVVWDVRCQLGGGPVWLAEAETLLFCDVERGLILSFDPAAGEGRMLEVGGRPSFVYPTADGRLLFGSERMLKVIGADSSISIEAQIETIPRNRTNDAAVDRLGRLWFGVSDELASDPCGTQFRYSDGRMIPVVFDVIVPNGPAVSDDCRTYYHVDSARRMIERHEITAAGALSNAREFVRFGEADGCPHGIVIDSEDCLWVAMWDGGCVRRYSPEAELLFKIDLPCTRVTKIAFGGPDLRTAYVTTARTGLNKEQLARQPLAGSLFAFDAPVAGRPVTAVSLGHGDLGLIEGDDH